MYSPLPEPASSARASKARMAAISSASLSVIVALSAFGSGASHVTGSFSCSASPFRHFAISLRIEPRPGLLCERAVILFQRHRRT
jgi:hypothetical protein